MKNQKEKRYRLTMTEKQLHYMMAAVEDWHRFLCGQCELSNATAYADECHDAREALQKHVRPYIVPELPDPRSSYGWSGGGCPNKYQREAIAVTYMLYREPMHYLTVHSDKDTSWNVYNSDTLTCPEQGPLIKIEEVEE